MSDDRTAGLSGPTDTTVQHLTTGYNGNVVLRDLSLEIKRGQIVVILGPSGVGKTTLLRCMIGLLVPQSGENPDRRQRYHRDVRV